ncbi:PIR Superfamily Protein [Plasmodium ovale curtisi]|uniref:PIR Superfamily Protein n=1 Tax=Plasmodium ovale curtisi TaxID=864141 RepID=A0A1A8X6X1_PLAOA|nr:PIR Superfamily Protein [Plasmodium ovale curtisi]SBS99973.1 PIR Superfamily Protein [Plasmodium ovale curtisi]
MPIEIKTIYNAATLNYRFKEKLNSYKNCIEKKNIDGCHGFNNEHLNTGVIQNKICEAVIQFLTHLKEETKDTTYRDNGCKYLYYWLYTHMKKDQETIKNTLKLYEELYRIYNQKHDLLNTFDNYIKEMNEHTSEKLVKLTDMYNILDNFYEGEKPPKPKVDCISGVAALYTKYLDECIKGYDDDFCDELKNFRKKHNFIIQKVLLCEGEQYLLPPVVRVNRVDMTIIPYTLISVTSFILPILYKFTAFGPWIRHLIGKNRNMLDNINEEPNQLLDTYEIGDDNSNMLNYNIAYNFS